VTAAVELVSARLAQVQSIRAQIKKEHNGDFMDVPV
jgi:hypothetical protein